MRRGILPVSVVALVSVLLSACGGPSGSSSSTIGGGGSSTQTPTLAITLVNSSGTSISRVDGSAPGIVRAQVTNGTGNSLVSFTTTIGQLNPSSGTALTDSSGLATIELEAGTTAGAGTIQATATVNNVNVSSNTLAFEVLPLDVIAEGLQIGLCSGGSSALDCVGGTMTNVGDIQIAVPTISARGTSALSVVVVDGSGNPVPNVSVDFTSRCTNLVVGGETQATISAGVSNAQGVVNVTYQATGCSGNDNITANEPTSDVSATGTINVLDPLVNNIEFVDNQNSAGDSIDTIYFPESGGISTASVVFKVIDVFGDPVEGATVSFALSTTIGGLSLQNVEGVTDDQGLATAFVNSGYVVATVSVTAQIDVDENYDGVADRTVSTGSEGLSVSTGLPDQDSFTFSAVNYYNVEGEDYNGTTSQLSVQLADHFNNPIRDGTNVQFTTEYGRVTPSCQTVGGDCTVTWNSQQPKRPMAPEVDVRDVSFGCPSAQIYEEPVTISGTAGDTAYVVSSVKRVETAGDVLVPTTDYTVDSDGSGITCTGGACTDGASLKISYDRLYLDEDGGGVITTPGVATAPFVTTPVGQGDVPCRAAARAASTTASAYNGAFGQIYGGRSTVLAFAQGEEAFDDTNGNGRYDFGEPFTDLPEAFLDTNEDGVFNNGNPAVDDSRDAANPLCYGPTTPLSATPFVANVCHQVGGTEDRFIDFNQDGIFNAGNGIYNGTLCPKEVSDRTATCNNTTDPCTSTDRYCTRTLVNIRASLTVLSAGSFASMGVRDAGTGEYISSINLTGAVPGGQFTAADPVVTNGGVTVPSGTAFAIGWGDTQVAPGIGRETILTSGSGSFYVDISDQFGGLMPGNTTISVTSSKCAIDSGSGNTIASSSGYGPFVHGVALSPGDNPPDGGAVTIQVTTPNSNVTQTSISCSY